MIRNASIRKSNSPVLHKTRFQMLFPHLLAMLAYNKKIFFLLLTKFILRNVPKSDKILIIQWYAKKRNGITFQLILSFFLICIKSEFR